MEFRNLTPFPAMGFDSLDQRDALFHTVVLRQTFELQADLSLAFAEEQAPLVMSDMFYGEMNESSVKQESDLAPFKPNTDVIVIANGYSPALTPMPRFMVGIKIIGKPAQQPLPPYPQGLNQFLAPSDEWIAEWKADCARVQRHNSRDVVLLDKNLIVTGPRQWRKNTGLKRGLSLFSVAEWSLTEPQPIVELPIRYEYAWGGANKVLASDKAASRVKAENRLPPALIAASSPPVVAHTVCLQNPLGMGFAEPWFLDATDPQVLSAPQIEAPDAPIVNFGQPGSVQGMGVTGRAWQPRLPLAGTYDEKWIRQRHPYLPFDFNFGYWNAAPVDQQITPYLEGDETIILINLLPPSTPGRIRTADGFAYKLSLPGHLPFVLVRFENGAIGELPAKLDTLILDLAPDPAQPDKKPAVSCVWRATVAGTPAVRVLEARMLASKAVQALRAQERNADSLTY